MSSGSPPRFRLGLPGSRKSPRKNSPTKNSPPKRLRIGISRENEGAVDELYPQPGVETATNEIHTNVSKKGAWGIPAYASKLIFIKDRASGKHTKTRKYVNYRLGHKNSVKKTKHEGNVYRALQAEPEFAEHFLPFMGANTGAEWAYVNFKPTDTQDLIDVLNDMFITNSVDEKYIRRIAKQIFEGLLFLAKKGYIHGDVKVDNVLVDGDKAYVIDLADSKRDPATRFIEAEADAVHEMLVGGFRFSRGEIEPFFKDPIEGIDDLIYLYKGLIHHFDTKKGGRRTRKNRRYK